MTTLIDNDDWLMISGDDCFLSLPSQQNCKSTPIKNAQFGF